MTSLARRTLLKGLAGAALGATVTIENGREAAAASRRPFPQHLVYAAGTIRPNHRTRVQQDGDVRAAYDRWKARYLVRAGTTPGGQPLYRIAYGPPGKVYPDGTVHHNRTVSEGQGYGMVIVVHLAGYDANAQAIFDGLYRFVRAHRSNIAPHVLMRWQVPGEPGGDASAFDGDCDIAYGLLLAHAQWGSGGVINYRQAARDHLTAMLHQTIGPSSRLPMLGDWTDPNGSPYNQFTPRTSDFMLGHFRAFARATGNGVWNDAVAACGRVITALQTNHSPNTGLLPDFVQPVSANNRAPRPASPGFLEGPHDGHYYFNAGRTPWRLGTHALLSSAPSTLAQVRKISTWAKTATGGNPQRLESGYTLNGQPVNDWGFSTFFAAPLGVAAMTRPAHQGWLNALYDAVRGRSEDYYEDTVTLLCLLVMSGNFWDPTVA